MRTCSRARLATSLAGSLVGLVVAVTALVGCSEEAADEEGGGGGAKTGAPTLGNADGVPFSLVLPDDLAVNQDGSQVLADCWDGICRWDTTDGSLDQVGNGSHVAISPDWSLIAGAGEDATVELVDTATGDVVRELAGHQDETVADGSPIKDVAFSPDGSLVASAGPQGRVIVWSVEDGSEIAAVETGTDVFALSFSPDGDRLAIGGDAPASVVDVASGDPVTTLPESAAASGFAWSPDGRWLATAGPGGAPAVWRTGDWRLIEQLPGGSLKKVAFAPDSRTIAFTDTEDDTVRLWTPEALGGGQGGQVRQLDGHTDPPGDVAFSPDGRTLYSVERTDGVFAWDVRTGRLADQFELPRR